MRKYIRLVTYLKKILLTKRQSGFDVLVEMWWIFCLPFLWPGAHSQMETFDVNITYENLGFLFVENTMCHINMDFNLEEFLTALQKSEEHFLEIEKWLVKVCKIRI